MSSASLTFAICALNPQSVEFHTQELDSREDCDSEDSALHVRGMYLIESALVEILQEGLIINTGGSKPHWFQLQAGSLYNAKDH